MLALSGCGNKNLESNLDVQAKNTGEYLLGKVKNPQISSVGGEWAIKGIAESGIDVEKEYFDLYYDNVRASVKSNEGEIHKEYYSDYSRLIIGISSIGKDPSNIEGYDITKYLDYYSDLTEQGINAVAYTLVAANIADIKLQYETLYVDFVIEELNKFISKNDKKDKDYIAMGIMGLSFYIDDKEVEKTINNAIDTLANMQEDDGTMGNCESTAETISAMVSVGINVFNDERFIKNGKSLGESLMEFSQKNGAFSHKKDAKDENVMATEKALIAINAMREAYIR